MAACSLTVGTQRARREFRDRRPVGCTCARAASRQRTDGMMFRFGRNSCFTYSKRSRPLCGGQVDLVPVLTTLAGLNHVIQMSLLDFATTSRWARLRDFAW